MLDRHPGLRLGIVGPLLPLESRTQLEQDAHVAGTQLARVPQRGLGVGGQLWIKYVSTEAPTQKGLNGAKVYSVAYDPPQQALMGDGEVPPLDDKDAPF